MISNLNRNVIFLEFFYGSRNALMMPLLHMYVRPFAELAADSGTSVKMFAFSSCPEHPHFQVPVCKCDVARLQCRLEPAGPAALGYLLGSMIYKQLCVHAEAGAQYIYERIQSTSERYCVRH